MQRKADALQRLVNGSGGAGERLGEVLRLFAKGFAGGHDLLSLPTKAGAGSGDLQLAVAHDAVARKYSILSANETTTGRTINLNVDSWNVAPGAVAIVEEVSSTSHGEVRQLVTVPASGILTLNQPAQSVLLVSVPEAAPAYRVSLTATDDAMVKGGSNSGANFGTNVNLYAKNELTNSAARNVSFTKFDLGAIPIDSVEQAVLCFYGENAGSANQVIAHVYGIVDDAWNESTITWSNAPNLVATTGTLNSISQNFIEGIGESATILGHFTGTQTERELMLDVTSFVREHPDQQVSILIAREVRFDGENVDDDLTSLKLASKERGAAFAPQLLLSLNESALPADFDGSDYFLLLWLTVAAVNRPFAPSKQRRDRSCPRAGWSPGGGRAASRTYGGQTAFYRLLLPLTRLRYRRPSGCDDRCDYRG